MNMYREHITKDLANKLDDLITKSISNTVIPIITRSGIVVGRYTIRSENGNFYIRYKNSIVQKTYTKTAALIIAGLLNKKPKSDDITNILYADYTLYFTKNDIESFKYHYDLAVKNNDSTKQGIMLSRFDKADEKYQTAKKVLQQSYSKLF